MLFAGPGAGVATFAGSEGLAASSTTVLIDGAVVEALSSGTISAMEGNETPNVSKAVKPSAGGNGGGNSEGYKGSSYSKDIYSMKT